MSSLQIKVIDKYYLNKGDRIVFNKYQIGSKIGQGSHSIIYAVFLNTIDIRKTRAIKVENQKVKNPQISKEVSIIKNIFASQPGIVGFPKLYQYGFQSDFNYMVMRMLGPNLAHLQKVCGGVFSLKTTLIIGLQILDRIQKMHNLGYLYVDMKPSNFLTGIGQDSVFIYAVDFGKCMLYKNKKNGNHIPYKECQNIILGQADFCSINCHNGIQYSRRDDIEALFYMLVFFLKGSLPWSGIQCKSKSERMRKIAELKKKLSPQSLSSVLNLHFADLIWYARTLSFYQKPDYEYIRCKLYSGLGQFEESQVIYDWGNCQQLNVLGLVEVLPKISLVQQIPSDLNHYPKNDGASITKNNASFVNHSEKQNQKRNSALKKNNDRQSKLSVQLSYKKQQKQQKQSKQIPRKISKQGVQSTTLGRQLDFEF